MGLLACAGQSQRRDAARTFVTAELAAASCWMRCSASDELAIRAVVVDALYDRGASFYRGFGFPIRRSRRGHADGFAAGCTAGARYTLVST
jgi:hypothetical protein